MPETAGDNRFLCHSAWPCQGHRTVTEERPKARSDGNTAQRMHREGPPPHGPGKEHGGDPALQLRPLQGVAEIVQHMAGDTVAILEMSVGPNRKRPHLHTHKQSQKRAYSNSCWLPVHSLS